MPRVWQPGELLNNHYRFLALSDGQVGQLQPYGEGFRFISPEKAVLFEGGWIATAEFLTTQGATPTHAPKGWV